MGKVKVLFVCMGNICRSPTAHGVFEALVKREGLGERIVVDSAGTHAYHVGEQPDPRSQSTARARGFDLSHLRARKAEAVDFDRFDYVLAMDSDNYANLSAICPQGMQDKLQMFLDFAPHLGIQDVPDPYYGGSGGFERVFDMVEAASEGLLADIRRRYL
ncbi:MAG: low molecular weight protein-tyrosine-phosphatase [Sedimenticola sp.]